MDRGPRIIFATRREEREMDEERDREEWTDEDERHLAGEGEEQPIPVQEAGLAVGLEGQDGLDPDVDPEIAAEVELQEETREAEGDEGHVETVLNFREEDEQAEDET
jgi:hypothetical protein